MSNYADLKCEVCGGRDRWNIDNFDPSKSLLVCCYCINPKSLRNVITAGASRQETAR